MNYQTVYEILLDYIPEFYPPNSHRVIPKPVYEQVVSLLGGDDKQFGFYFQGPLGPILVLPDRNEQNE